MPRPTLNDRIRDNLDLARTLAARFARSASLDPDDAFSAALVGLWEAASKERGARDRVRALAYRAIMFRLTDLLDRTHGAPFTDRHGVKRRAWRPRLRSLDEPAGNPEAKDVRPLADTLADGDQVNGGALRRPCHALEHDDTVAALSRTLSVMRPQWRTVIERRFGIRAAGGWRTPETLAAIGARLGVTDVRVQQIEAAALRWLRANMPEHHDLERRWMDGNQTRGHRRVKRRAYARRFRREAAVNHSGRRGVSVSEGLLGGSAELVKLNLRCAA